jgi:predicted NAD-dependent protein-ADP-ribosyltransferase YbiA (DUF1768 family)
MDIKLFNTNDKFSKLSNDAYSSITVDGQKYPSVTNYIYSNMLTTPTFRQIIQNTKIKAVKKSDNELIKAIDFLLEKENLTESESESELVSISDMKKFIIKYNKDFLDDQRRGFSKIKAEYEKLKKEHFPDEEKSQIKKDKTKVEEYKSKISNEVRKPFKLIDLKQLKQQLIDLSTINQMGLYKLFDSYAEQELYNTIRNACEKGYTARVKIPEIAAILLSTGNYPIRYESEDPFLGVGLDSKGANIVGTTLMQLRHNLRIQKNTDYTLKNNKDYEKNIYNIYLAYTALTKEMFVNKNWLTDYIGLTPNEIIKKYGAYNLINGILSQTDVINMYKKNKLNPIIMTEINNPGKLVINFRKHGMSQLQDMLTSDKNEIIFNSYLEYMIKKNYIDEIDKETEQQFNKSKNTLEKNTIKNNIIQRIIATQKNTLPSTQLKDIKYRVIDLFKLGMLSASLSDLIDKDITLLNIPLQQDVEQAEEQEIEIEIEQELKKTPIEEEKERSSVSDEIQDPLIKQFKSNKLYNKVKELKAPSSIEGTFNEPTGDPVIIYRNIDQNISNIRALAPEEYTGMLNIDNFYYPTIQHYIIARLIADVGVRRKIDLYGNISITKGVGINEGHKMIMVDPNLQGKVPEEYLTIILAGQMYDKVKKETDNLLFPLYTLTALTLKFEDKDMQDLLLLTGDKQIKWNNPHNLYLGSGTEENKGINYVGKTMMDIREKIKENRKYNKINIKLLDLIEFIQTDSFLMEWIKTKLTDMCNIINKTQIYLKIKTDLDINIQEDKLFKKLIKSVLNTMFRSCNYINSDTVPVPDFFVNMVKKCSIISGIKPSKIKNSKGESKWNKEIQKMIDETDKDITKLELEVWGSQIDHSIEESKIFEENQRKEWNKLWNQLNASGASLKEKNTEAELFKKQQKDEFNEFWGINKKHYNTSTIEHKKKELKKQLNDFLKESESLDNHYNSLIIEIAQILWDNIYNMLNIVIQNTNPSTSHNIKTFLVKVEDINSQKNKCIKIVKNEKDNCIVSAILNLLSSINTITETITPTYNEKLDENSVKLAGSIIMNNSFANVSDIKLELDQTDQLDQLDQTDQTDQFDQPYQFDVDDEGLFPDDDDENKEIGDYGDNPYFEFGSQKKQNTNDIDNIIKHISRITTENTKQISQYIIKMVETIKDNEMSKKIKQSRINYFATIM